MHDVTGDFTMRGVEKIRELPARRGGFARVGKTTRPGSTWRRGRLARTLAPAGGAAPPGR